MSDATHEHPAQTGFTFGPTALVTPANAVTVARLLAAPVYVLMLVAWGASWVNVVVGFFLAASDGLDGYMARRHGTTRSGAFLDPLADKAVVLGALITLAAQSRLPWLPVVLITAREVGMQAYRSWVGRRGVSIPARKTAKLKTLVQDLAIGVCIIPPLAHQHDLQVAMIWFACALTLYTGAEYLLDGRRALHVPPRPPKVTAVRIEIVAVGTELLLGQIADTNSAWLGEHLAANGVASHFHQAVGDNHDRITLALRTALARSDGVIMCGGLGPTQDDITREAIAEVMNVPLERDQQIVDYITAFFRARGREMSENNARQADVPHGARVIPQTGGTAPGLICPVGNKVVYAVPGVPYEMIEMFERGILPDFRARMAETGEEGVIASRVLRSWGASESALAESLQDRIDALDAAGNVTLAFLASGIEGIKVRITARARTLEDVTALLDKEEAEVRRAISERLGDIVFGVDDESMEVAVATRLVARDLSFGVAESLTGGLIASRLVNVPGASKWFRGGVVAYDSQVKFDVLGVPAGPVVTEAAAAAMADGAARVTGAEVGLGITGVAGPEDQEGVAPGTLFVGLKLPGQSTQTRELRVPGDRERVRQYGAITALDLLRRALDALPS